MLLLGMAQLLFISRNTGKLFNRSWREVVKFRFVHWGSGLFLLHFHRLTAAELIWFPAKEEQNGLSSCISWLADVELNCLLVCSQCRCSLSLIMSILISGLFTRQIPPALCSTVPQVSVTTSEKSFCKKCVYQGVLEREALLLTVPFLAAQCCSQRAAVCVLLGASSPLDGAGGTDGSRAGTKPSYSTQGWNKMEQEIRTVVGLL